MTRFSAATSFHSHLVCVCALICIAPTSLSGQSITFSTQNQANTHSVTQTISGTASLKSELATGRTALSLVLADFDQDGTQDLATGYATKAGGAILVQRGSASAMTPSLDELKATQSGGMPVPFLTKAAAIKLPSRPDLLHATDLDGNGTLDLIAATRGGRVIYILFGNGVGGFSAPIVVPIQGELSSLAVEKVADGTTLLVAGICDGNSCGLQILAADGTVRGKIPLPAAATLIEIAATNGGIVSDLEAIAGGQAFLIDGDSVLSSTPLIETLPVNGAASIASGTFLYSFRGSSQIAVLGTDATLHIFSRSALNTAARTQQQKLTARIDSLLNRTAYVKPIPKPWTEIETVANVGPGGPAPLMIRSRVSGNSSGDDLIVLANRQYVVVAHNWVERDGSTISQPRLAMDTTNNTVVAAMPARVSADARFGLITAEATAQPNVAVPPTNKTFTVNTTADTLDALSGGRCTTAGSACSLRDAVAFANLDFANGFSKTDVVIIPAGTYTLSLNAGLDSGGDLGFHLQVNSSVSFVGAGTATTIINANHIDKAFSINPPGIGNNAPFDVFFSNLTISNGTNRNDQGSTANPYGGVIDWDSDGPGNLTFTNVAITGGINEFGPGGGFYGSNNGAGGSGLVDFESSTVSGNGTIEGGGGIQVDAATPLTVNNTTVSGNKSAQSVFPSDTTFVNPFAGGIAANGGTTEAIVITNSTITGNTTTGTGGGIFSLSPLTVTNTIVTNNSAGNYGGGLSVGTNNGATNITTSTITGNALTTSTGSGFRKSDGAGICVSAGPAGQSISAAIHYSRIRANTGGTATGLGVGCGLGMGLGLATVSATDNWWGCNGPANGLGCDTGSAAQPTNETLTLTPYTTLTVSLSSATPAAGASFTATGSLGQDSSSAVYSAANAVAYDGLPATLTVTQQGASPVSSSATTLTNSASLASFAAITNTGTATAPGMGVATVTVDGTAVSANFTVSASDLKVTSAHAGNFKAGDVGDVFTLTVANAGNAATSGTVTVVDTLPAGFTATAISGTGWVCTTGTLTCTRADSLAASTNYPVITLTVSVASANAGTYTNVANVSGGGELNTGNDSYSDSTIVVATPTIAESFAPTSVAINANSAVIFTLGNPAANSLSLTGVAFVDSLPGTLKVATPNGAATTCTGSTVTAAPGGSSIALSGATIPVGTTCTVSVNVFSSASGSFTNTTGAVSATNANAGSTASATLIVNAPPAIVGSFGTPRLLINGSTSLSFQITNPNGSSIASNVTFADPLPSGLVVATPNGVTGSCGGGTITATAGSSSIGLLGASIAADSSCNLAVNVTATTAGLKTNSETASSLQGGSGAPSNQSVTVFSTATATSLSITPASPVSSGTVVSINSAVTSTITLAPVTTGVVLFYDTSTTPSTLIGSAELNSSGAIAIKLVLGVGNHTIVAQYQGTSAFLGKSSSAATPYVVTSAGTYKTLESLTASASGASYNFTDTATFYGLPAPGGTVQFRDLTTGTLLGTVAPTSVTQTLAAPAPNTTGAASVGSLASATGDFNKDGFPDIAVSNLVEGTVSVLLGNGDGTFKPQVSYKAGDGAYQIAVGDFNDDGNPDLVVSNLFSNNVSILIGRGDGTFAAAVNYATGTQPYSVKAVDLNNDGNADLAVTNLGDKTVSVLLGNGNGTFQTQTTTATGNNPDTVVTADFNADGNADLAVLNETDETVSVLLGKGDGTFQMQVLYAAGTLPYSATIGDFNGDGFPDLAVANIGDNTISVLLNSGTGTFQPQVTYATGAAPSSVIALTLDASGKQSLAVANYQGNTVSFLTGNGNGTFQPQVAFPSAPGVYQLSTADFNGDGKQDLAATSFTGNFVNVQLGTQTAIVPLNGITLTGVSGTHTITATYVPSGSDAYATSVGTASAIK